MMLPGSLRLHEEQGVGQQFAPNCEKCVKQTGRFLAPFAVVVDTTAVTICHKVRINEMREKRLLEKHKHTYSPQAFLKVVRH